MKYQIQVTFESDRVLTSDELNELLDTIALQVEEPTTLSGDEMDFITSAVAVSNANE